MSKIIRIILVLILFVPNINWAAGFDCKLASTKVEKMICADRELSGIDEELNVSYKTVLKKHPNPDSIKQGQRSWMHERNRCGNIPCLKKIYKKRNEDLGLLIRNLLPFIPQESYRHLTDEGKLELMQEIMGQYEFELKLDFMKESEFCQQLTKDFSEVKSFKVVAPIFHSNDENDARFDEINSCRDKPFPEGLSTNNFYHISMLHGPQYRYYKIELDGSLENGKEDVLYGEYNQSGARAGYSWIDPDKCIARSGVGVSTIDHRFIDYDFEKHPKFSLVVMYAGEPLVLKIKPSTPQAVYYTIGASRFGKTKKPRLCSWTATVEYLGSE